MFKVTIFQFSVCNLTLDIYRFQIDKFWTFNSISATNIVLHKRKSGTQSHHKSQYYNSLPSYNTNNCFCPYFICLFVQKVLTNIMQVFVILYFKHDCAINPILKGVALYHTSYIICNRSKNYRNFVHCLSLKDSLNDFQFVSSIYKSLGESKLKL